MLRRRRLHALPQGALTGQFFLFILQQPADVCPSQAVDGDTEITDEDAPLQLMYEDKTGFLTETHTTFFKKWEKLISYEEQELVRFKKEIWTMGAEERMQVGR